MARLVGLAVLAAMLAACNGYAPTAGDPAFPLVACPLEGPGSRTPPPGYMLVAPGTIAFGTDLAWHNVSGGDIVCGAQAVSGATSVIRLASLAGEWRIIWAATLARPGHPTEPDAVPPTMTLVRLEPSGRVVVDTAVDEPSDEYSMRGSYDQDATPGSYEMRIVSNESIVLAEGGFQIVP